MFPAASAESEDTSRLIFRRDLLVRKSPPAPRIVIDPICVSEAISLLSVSPALILTTIQQQQPSI